MVTSSWGDCGVIALDGLPAGPEAVLPNVPWIGRVVDAIVEAVVHFRLPSADQIVVDSSDRLLSAALIVRYLHRSLAFFLFNQL